MSSTTDTKTHPTRAPRADAVRNRAAVVEAARKVMGKRGLEAGMDEISRAAGVGVGTVYRHFPAKDDLIAALVDYRFERLAEFAHEALAEDDPGPAFERMVNRAAELQAGDRALAEVMRDRGELMGQAAARVGMLELTREVLTRAQRAGAIRPDLEPEDVPMMLCGMGTATCGGPAPFRGPDSWRRFIGITLDGMRAGAGGELPPHWEGGRS